MLVTDCCGVPAKGNSDDYGLCPCCKDHCEYVDDEEQEEDKPVFIADVFKQLGDIFSPQKPKE